MCNCKVFKVASRKRPFDNEHNGYGDLRQQHWYRKKGGKASTARRKGGRNAKQPEVTTIIDRPFYNNANNTTSNGQSVPTASQIRSPHILPPSMAYPEPSRVTSFQTVPSTVASVELSQMQSPQTHPIPVAFGGPSTATSSQTLPPPTFILDHQHQSRRIRFISLAVLPTYCTFLLWMFPDIETKWSHNASTIRSGHCVKNENRLSPKSRL